MLKTIVLKPGSDRAVQDIYTSFHIEKYKTQTHVTSHDPKRLTNEIHENEGHLDLQKDSNNQKKGNYKSYCN